MTDEARTRQRWDALRRANECRSARASLKARIEAGTLPVTDLLRELEDHAWCMGKTTVHEVFTWPPMMGKVRAKNFLTKTRVFNKFGHVNTLSPETVRHLIVCWETRTETSGRVLVAAVEETRAGELVAA